MCGITDCLAADLGGRLVTDHSMAASWGGLDLSSRDWDRSTLDALGIPEAALPPLLASAEPIGPVSPASASALGIDPDTVVCAGIGDHQASVLGCRPIGQRSCVVNIGTGGQVSLLTAQPYTFEGLETRPLFDDHFVVTGASLCGGWAYHFLEGFFRSVVHEFGGRQSHRHALYESMNRIGERAPADAGGLAVEPLFLGSRTEPLSRGSIAGIDASNLNPANLVRAMANGIVDELFRCYALAGQPARVVHAAGNAIRRNPLLIQAIARRWGVEPVVAAHGETGAYGAACLAAVRLGLARPGWLVE